MIDLNDPEVIESLRHLLIQPADKIKFQSMPFDGKKQCWAPDAKEGFVAAEITETKDNQVTVKTSKGEVKHRKKTSEFEH